MPHVLVQGDLGSVTINIVLPVKVQRVSGRRISRWIFIAHRPVDSQVEEPHGSPAQLSVQNTLVQVPC